MNYHGCGLQVAGSERGRLMADNRLQEDRHGDAFDNERNGCLGELRKYARPGATTGTDAGGDVDCEERPAESPAFELLPLAA